VSAMGAYQDFDYTDEQWAAIEREIALVRSAPLNRSEKSSLFILYGNMYLHSVRSGQSLEARLQERTELWTVVRNLAEELLPALNRAMAMHVYNEKYIVRMTTLLDKLRNDAALFGKPWIQKSPKEEYYEDVLSIWVDHCGGQLKKSRDKTTKKPKGPLLRFFMAVTYPVMGIDAPKPETIFDIVDREKLRRKAAESL
jgi:hypothetical protein